TMLGIVFGVAAVIAMLSIGEGARQEALAQIELMGTNNIIITKITPAQDTKSEKKSFSTGLTLNDADAIRELNPFVEFITPQLELKIPVNYKSQILETTLIGTTVDYFQTFNTKIESGSSFKSFHSENYSNVCVIGSGIKEQLFKFDEAVGKKIKIGDLWFEIIGIASPKNVSTTGSGGISLRDFNQDIYIPFSTMMYKIDINEAKIVSVNRRGISRDDNSASNIIDRNTVDQLTVKVKKSDQLRETANLIERILSRRHYGVKDYEIILPEQLLQQKQKTQKIFNIVMGAIAGISLLVGGIGIMNIMLANIMERTREIGVRRAVGATRLDILSQFVYEALTISIIGGITGIILGFLLTSIITTYAEWKTIISPFSVFLAFFVSVATGLIFGIYPAKQAADKNPIESLRYE
ncbi:MAG: ABC transporter permease, partial [Ignavibacteriaceae bacterium]